MGDMRVGVEMRVILALLLILILGGADSKVPSRQESQGNTHQYNRGTEDAPVVVKVLPADKTQTELAKEETEKRERVTQEKAAEARDLQLVKLTGDLALYTKLLFVATAILALITGVLVVVGFFQVRDARKGISAAEKSANAAETSANVVISQLRAYIHAEPTPGIPFIFDADEPMARVEIRNVGQTPAYDVMTWSNLVPIPDPLPTDFDFPVMPSDWASPTYTLGPGRANGMGTKPIPRVTPEEKRGLQSGALAWYHWAEIHYRDAFGTKRWIKFRVKWLPSTGGWEICKGGNDAN